MCIEQIVALSELERDAIKQNLYASPQASFNAFFTHLRRKLDKVTDRIAALPLFGEPQNFAAIDDAFKFIDSFDVKYAASHFQKYEIIVDYSNKDEVKGIFTSKERVKEFLTYISS